MKKKHKNFLFWLLLVVFWNFGFPEAKPIFDVFIAILFSAIVNFLNRGL
tara:strand:+ start:33171 stop:33317 length:147 start_codon:yes stop_codon:yes gene_type:complete